MKKNFLKKILGLGAAVAMMACMVLPAAAAPETVTSATEMGATYYASQNLSNPSLTIEKYVTGSDGQVDTSQPINGVKFKYMKIGGLYEVKSGTKTAMAYGISDDFAALAGLTADSADYKDASNYYYKDGETIQTAVRNIDVEGEAFTNYFVSAEEDATGEKGEDGKIQATLNASNAWGLYLVVESDVSEAQVKNTSGVWESVSITQSQKPFVASVPVFNKDDNTWNAQVVARVKNSTSSATIEKKIITSDAIPEHVKDGTYDDTDTTSIGDTVYFRLKGTVVSIPSTSSESVEKYIMTDNISKGLNPDLSEMVVKTYNGTTEEDLTSTTDYTVSQLSPYSGTEKAFEGGKTFTITFTDIGLGKLKDLAKEPGTTKEVYAYYPATVTADAVIGPNAEGAGANSGNPNQVKLTYQVSGSAEMNTGWDTVTEFTFGIDVTKQLDGRTIGNDNKANIQFIVYSGTQGNETYYSFSGSDGVYHTPSNVSGENDATRLSPNASGQILIKGLDEGTYKLKEVATVNGYNLLKEPVELTITPIKGSNVFVGTTNQYLGTIENDTNDNDGYAEATVINTKGFTLPSTGGAGIWMFVIGGVLVIGAGCVYFMMTKRRKEGR